MDEFSEIARSSYESYTGDNKSTSFILVYLDSMENVKMALYEAPFFNKTIFTENFKIIGSGGVVSPCLTKYYSEIKQLTHPLNVKVTALMTKMEAELKKQGIQNVGGLFQTILITRKGIAPMRYAFVDLTPESPTKAKEMIFENGKWHQKNYATGTTTTLDEPVHLKGNIVRVHDYDEASPGGKDPRWYLNLSPVWL